MKTKKFFLLLFVLGAVLFVASCNGENNPPAHEHEFETVEAVAATCTEEGNVAYQHCSGCDKNFDADGNELEIVVIEALGHTEETVAGKAATCTEPGLTDGKKCSVCEAELVKQEVIPAGHTEEVVAGKAATCEEPGLTDGKKCSVCGETTVEQEVIPAGHTLEEVVAVDATCTEDGNVAHEHCSVCGKNFDAEGVELEKVVIESLGHTLEEVAAVDATCTEDGNIAHEHCSVCEKNFDAEGVELEKVVIDALGHTEEVVEGYAATCTDPGLTDGKKCSVCNVEILAQEEIHVLEHEFDESAWGYKEADGHAHLCKHCDAHDEIVAHTSRENLPVLEEDVCTVCGYVINPAQVTLESLFTEEVLENKYEFNMTQHDVTIDFYAVKDNERVYFVANYYTKTPDTDGGWWERDNFELRLNTPSGFVSNGKPFDPSFFGSDKQWFISVNNESNFEYFIISQPVDSDREGYKVIEFVAYLSFDKLGIESDTPLGFTIGSNPGGKGFIGSKNWESVDLLKLKKITTKGILDYCLPENCAHVYGDYITTTPATCKEDGMKEATCPYCQHVDQVVIPATGEHVYDLSTAEVITPSTCSINGTAIAKCGCGHEGEVELDFDLTNHGDHWNSETNTCACGSLVNNAVVDIDHANFHYLEYVMDGTKDFEFDVILTAEHNASSSIPNNDKDNCWGHNFTAEIFSEGWMNGGWSYRTDWSGWGQWTAIGKASYTDVNTGSWSEKFYEASANMDIIYNLKYFAAEGKFVITMTYHSNVEPYSAEDKHLTYVLSGIGYKGAMHVGFGVEKAKATFKYVKYTVGEAAGPELDGKMDDAHWTEEVKANSVQLRNGDDAIMDLYATRDDFAVYFFAKFQVRELKNTSDNWWEKDNVELRLLVNGAKVFSIDENVQWYVSRTGKWLCNNAYITEAVFNEETGYYEFAFEFYAANSHLEIDANTEVGLTYSMVTYKGWQGCADFETTDMNLVKKITKEGIR